MSEVSLSNRKRGGLTGNGNESKAARPKVKPEVIYFRRIRQFDEVTSDPMTSRPARRHFDVPDYTTTCLTASLMVSRILYLQVRCHQPNVPDWWLVTPHESLTYAAFFFNKLLVVPIQINNVCSCFKFRFNRKPVLKNASVITASYMGDYSLKIFPC